MTDKNTYEKNLSSYRNDGAVKHYTKISGKIKPIEMRLIDKYFSGKILDLGCGCGRTTKYIFDKGHDVKGVEIIEAMVSVAKDRYPDIKFLVGDACKLRFDDKSFDVVFFSFNGLDYIHPERERMKAIEEIARVLKPGGYFIYSSHNPLALFRKIRPKFLVRNFLRKSILKRYKLEMEPFGEFHTYYATPKKQIRDVQRETNLKHIAMDSNGWGDIFPHYVFKKEMDN